MQMPVLIGVTASAAMIGLAGCGSESSDTGSPTATVGSEGGQVEIGNTINYGSVGTTTELDCADGKSLNIGGNNNKLTVKGTCANANIGGADNTVTMERVDKELSVVGFNNTITYKDGDPKINDTGSGNKINKG
ncbi:hypothetical protein CQY20_28985 [Mycolicibacterium agri]|uniref:DUF3060 domain-containing protein n=1 Tax=Mycolicibacterium agri TaxID=36811 RepID=A0A2A7MQ19_MYCAG|nr:DUF3060 domain-containing protein [Mycolicibacterium agri]PEG33774.1 hypothetical protein CQY20_28985 [Mycolicibacterium agri]GFG52174.1 hypothetical protein MAGR_36150 [Mycolicibacterium agri]